MRVALTGTPGVGKSTLADLLKESGHHVVDLAAWAADNGALAGTDPDGTGIIDTDAIDVSLLPPDCFIDSHMAHALDVDAVWIIRCHPQTLKARLESRGYAPAKVQENLEAEAMDLILQEAMDRHRVGVQRDGTHADPHRLLAAFLATDTEGLKSWDMEPVDWSEWLLEGN